MTLVLLTMRLLRHVMRRSMGSGFLEVVEAMPVGRGVQLLLVRIGDEHLVLGVSDSRVTRITDVALESTVGDVDTGQGREQAEGTFLDTMRHMIGGTRGG